MRLESVAAASQRALAEATAARFPALEPAWLQAGGGIAAFLELDSPVNGTFGLGMGRSVSAPDIRKLERFFAERGERALAGVCPLAHPTLLRVLAARGWMPAAFENVLARPLVITEMLEPPADGIEVRVALTEAEIELWAALVANGFSAPEDPTPAELHLARVSPDVPGTTALLGYVDGKPAGTGEVAIDGEIAWLTTDTTLPEFRRRGVQMALQCARLLLARDAGCTLAVTESLPGSASQRNMERLGFNVVYTRVEVLGPATSKKGRSS